MNFLSIFSFCVCMGLFVLYGLLVDVCTERRENKKRTRRPSRA